jgi:hypothetical protein
MTLDRPFIFAQISPPEAQLGLRHRFKQTNERPSRLAEGQRRDRRLAPQALNVMPAANRTGVPPAPDASPPVHGEGPGVGGTRPPEAQI